MSEDSKSKSGGIASRVLGRGERPGSGRKVTQAATSTRCVMMAMDDTRQSGAWSRPISERSFKFNHLSSTNMTTCVSVTVRVQAVAIRSSIILIRFLFDSVPTRSCLGTWQTMLSSPLLVTWKSNPLALGPRLNALLQRRGHSSTKPSRTPNQ
jgi:hypothetical protein